MMYLKRYKAINSNGIAHARAPSTAVVSKHYLSKALIQLPRNIDDHAIAHFSQNLAFFLILQREPQNC